MKAHQVICILFQLIKTVLYTNLVIDAVQTCQENIFLKRDIL